MISAQEATCWEELVHRKQQGELMHIRYLVVPRYKDSDVLLQVCVSDFGRLPEQGRIFYREFPPDAVNYGEKHVIKNGVEYLALMSRHDKKTEDSMQQNGVASGNAISPQLTDYFEKIAGMAQEGDFKASLVHVDGMFPVKGKVSLRVSVFSKDAFRSGRYTRTDVFGYKWEKTCRRGGVEYSALLTEREYQEEMAKKETGKKRKEPELSL